jgi:hypothetical protein
MNNQENQKESLLSHIFSMKVLLFLVGCLFLVSGYYRDEPAQYFWGFMIVAGSIAIHFVRKKDWKKHWEEQERLSLLHKEQQRRKAEERKGD